MLKIIIILALLHPENTNADDHWAVDNTPLLEERHN